MYFFRNFMKGLRSDRRGVTALEYGLIAGVLVATVAVGFSTLSDNMSSKFSDIGTKAEAMTFP